MLKNDEAFKVFSKLFFERGLNYKVTTDYELLNLPKRVDVVVVKGPLTLAKSLNFFAYFKEHNIISFKSFTDRLNKRDFYDALIYGVGYAKNEKLRNFRGITVTIISAYKNKSVLEEFEWERIREGVYRYEGVEYELVLVVLNEVKLRAREWDLALLFMFGGRRKLWELKRWLKENKESFKQMKTYLFTLLPLFRQEGLSILEEVGEMGRKGEFVIDIAENLRYLKKMGFNVKTYEEIFSEGIQKGIQQGIQKGLQQGIQQGLFKGLLEAVLLDLELRFGKEGLRYREELEQIGELEKLRALKKAVLEVKDLKEFEEVLRRCSSN
jgi:hypothetical protein